MKAIGRRANGLMFHFHDKFAVATVDDAVPNLCRVADLAVRLRSRTESTRSWLAIATALGLRKR
jgi:hypothetical protein